MTCPTMCRASVGTCTVEDMIITDIDENLQTLNLREMPSDNSPSEVHEARCRQRGASDDRERERRTRSSADTTTTITTYSITTTTTTTTTTTAGSRGLVICPALALHRCGGIKTVVTADEHLRRVPDSIRRHLGVPATR